MKKVFTFLPGHRPSGADRDSADSLGSVSRRREQLRKAQRTHRQRKHQYFKSVESEVLRLRTIEVNLLVQVQSLSDQVNILQRTLEQHGLSEVAALNGKLGTINSCGSELAMNKASIPGYQELGNEETSRELPAGMDFGFTDPSTHSICQDDFDHVILDHLPKPHAGLNKPRKFEKLDQLSGPPVVDFEPDYSLSGSTGLKCNQDMVDMGMEFVMALENPCRPHLELHLDKPNGHALLTSATLKPTQHHQCLPLTASNQTQKFHTAQNPRRIFEKLLALSGQLVVEDEISPTQAWHYILQQPWASKLDAGGLRILSASLLMLIECHGFGAVMQKNAFENILFKSLSRTSLD